MRDFSPSLSRAFPNYRIRDRFPRFDEDFNFEETAAKILSNYVARGIPGRILIRRRRSRCAFLFRSKDFLSGWRI